MALLQSQPQLMKQIADLMLVAERTISIGTNRKEYVLRELRRILGDEEFVRQEVFINLAIETVILISHSNIDIKKINPKSWSCCK
jgi:hypothetical protein